MPGIGHYVHTAVHVHVVASEGGLILFETPEAWVVAVGFRCFAGTQSDVKKTKGEEATAL
jgi:hypothetical protein